MQTTKNAARAELNAARTDERLAQTKMNDARRDEEQARKALDKAIRSGASQRVLDARHSNVEAAAAVATLADAAYEAAKAKADALEAARQARIRAYYADLDYDVQERFGAEIPGLQMRCNASGWGGGVSYELSLLEMDLATGKPVTKTGTHNGETYTYNERRFGMDVTVYGPRYEMKFDREAAKAASGTISEDFYRTEITPSALNYGSGGGSPEKVEEMIGLYTLAVALARYLDRYAAENPCQDELY